MTELLLKESKEQEIPLGKHDNELFESCLEGYVIVRGSEKHKRARAVWNGMIDKKPGLIVRCSSSADVVQPTVRLPSTVVRKIITGAQLLNQRYPPQDRKIRIRKEICWVSFFCRADFFEFSRHRFRPIITPGNSRQNSEHNKRYRKYSLWDFRITRGFSQ